MGSMSLNSRELGIKSSKAADRPPVLIPFFAFRVMVGCGFLTLGLAWAGSLFAWSGRLERRRWFLWLVFFSFPLGFLTTLTGWFRLKLADSLGRYTASPVPLTQLCRF